MIHAHSTLRVVLELIQSLINLNDIVQLLTALGICSSLFLYRASCVLFLITAAGDKDSWYNPLPGSSTITIIITTSTTITVTTTTTTKTYHNMNKAIASCKEYNQFQFINQRRNVTQC